MSVTLEVGLPEGARVVAGSLAAAGYPTLIVGGTVRDALMGRPVSDVDLATEASVDDVKDLMSRMPWVDATWDAGVRFGTLGVAAMDNRIEISTLRGEDGDGPDLETRFAADALMRDFTVNALGVVLPDSVLLDPTGGRADIASKILRAPGSAMARFAEDPLRVLRLARFAAELGFDIEPATMQAATETADEVAGCAAERVRSELWRVLAAPEASRGLRIMRDTGALGVVLPEAASGDTVLGEVAKLPSDPERRLAALLAGTTGAEVQALCDRLRCSRAQARRTAYFLDHGVEADPEAPPVPSPLGGNAIIAELGVAPGPMVGLVKTALIAAVTDGLLAPDDRDAAIAFARTVLGMDGPAAK